MYSRKMFLDFRGKIQFLAVNLSVEMYDPTLETSSRRRRLADVAFIGNKVVSNNFTCTEPRVHFISFHSFKIDNCVMLAPQS